MNKVTRVVVGAFDELKRKFVERSPSIFADYLKLLLLSIVTLLLPGPVRPLLILVIYHWMKSPSRTQQDEVLDLNNNNTVACTQYRSPAFIFQSLTQEASDLPYGWLPENALRVLHMLGSRVPTYHSQQLAIYRNPTPGHLPLYMDLVDGCADGLCYWDRVKNLVHYSPRWQSTLGYTNYPTADITVWTNRIHEQNACDVLKNLQLLQGGDCDETFDCEHQLRHDDGHYVWVRIRGKKISSGILFMMTDVTNNKLVEQKLLRRANYDELTQLLNQGSLQRHLQQLRQPQRKNDEIFAILSMDLNDFKLINDTYGHPAADVVLVECAKRIKEAVRPEDLAFRNGGDEFVVMLKQVSATEVESVIERIKRSVQKPVNIGDGGFVTASVSVGSCISDGREEMTVDEMMKRADDAMYNDKRSRNFASRMHRAYSCEEENIRSM